MSRGEYIPPQPRWTPFVEVDGYADNRRYNPGLDGECWRNSRYRVYKRLHESGDPSRAPLIHLSIKRLDGRPVRVWRDLQRIKNELLGDEAFAWETFPPESILVDTADQFHLWSIPGCELPTPFNRRLVATHEAGLETTKQTAWEPGETPADAIRTRAGLVAEMERLTREAREGLTGEANGAGASGARREVKGP